MPVGCNFENICLPGHSELCFEMKKGLNRIARSLNITLDHKNLVDDLYHLVGNDLRFAEGVQGEAMASLRNRFEGKAVCCHFDKRKQEVVIMCPQYWPSEVVKRFKEQDVIKSMPDDTDEINYDFQKGGRRSWVS